MQEQLVTIAVPVYNVSKYLDRCVKSLVNQTYKNIEILLIDDGSTDDCPHMCDRWADKDNRIRVIHKMNEGLGMARNTGIDNAKGEYICFFDSDDYVSCETIEKAYKALKDENADISIFGLNSTDSNGNITTAFVPKAKQNVYRGKEVTEKFLSDLIAPDPRGNGERIFYMSSCTMLYSMKILKESGWHFVSEREIISEDVYSLLSLFRYIDSVAVCFEALYYYCVNDTSLSRSYRDDRFDSIQSFYEKCMGLCEKSGYCKEVKHRVSKPYLAFTISAMKQELANKDSDNDKKAIVKSIIDDKVVQRVLKENKKDNVGRNRSVLFFAMRHKLYSLCFLLLKAKL